MYEYNVNKELEVYRRERDKRDRVTRLLIVVGCSFFAFAAYCLIAMYCKVQP